MSSSTNKTTATDASVDDFLAGIDEQKRRDSYDLISMMKRITGCEPVMWGASIIGFGTYHYKYATGHEGDMAMLGFSPRKMNMTIYIADGFTHYTDLLTRLGKHKISVSCLYIKSLDDIDRDVLYELLHRSYQEIKSWEGRS